MPNLKSELLIKLVDDVTGPANKVAEALKKSESQIRAIDTAFKGTGASARFQQQLASLGRSAADVDRVAAAMRGYASAAEVAGNASNWTKGQAAKMKRWETQTISALKAVSAQEKAFERQQGAVSEASRRRYMPHQGLGSVVRAGRGELAGTAGLFAGPGILHGAKETILAGADLESEKQKNAGSWHD